MRQQSAFALGLDFARQEADLLHLLFSARSRVVTGEMAKTDAASYLSGLVLGKDVAPPWRCSGFRGTGASDLHPGAGGALWQGAQRL